METTYELKLAVTYHCHPDDAGQLRRALLADAGNGTIGTILRNELGADDVHVLDRKVFEHSSEEE